MTPFEDLRNAAADSEYYSKLKVLRDVQTERHYKLFREHLAQAGITSITTPIEGTFFQQINSALAIPLGKKSFRKGVIIGPIKDSYENLFSGYLLSGRYFDELNDPFSILLKSLGVDYTNYSGYWSAKVNSSETAVTMKGINWHLCPNCRYSVDEPLLLALAMCPKNKLEEVNKDGLSVLTRSADRTEIVALAVPRFLGELVSGPALPLFEGETTNSYNLWRYLNDDGFQPSAIVFDIVPEEPKTVASPRGCRSLLGL